MDDGLPLQEAGGRWHGQTVGGGVGLPDRLRGGTNVPKYRVLTSTAPQAGHVAVK